MATIPMNDGFSHLLQPDSLLPSQYYAALRRKTAHEPERRLVIALLQDAVDCYQKHLFARDRKARQLYVDAEEWITSDEREWPFSFENVCELLNIHPVYLRRGLLEWRERALALGPDARVLTTRTLVDEDDDELRAASGV